MAVHPQAYLKGNCYVNHEYKYVYFAIPKIGSTSMKKKLSLKNDGSIYKNELIWNNSVADYFKFAIIRDPFERFLSVFIHMSSVQYMRARARHRYGYTRTKIERRYFKDFMKWLQQSFFDLHLYPQTYFLSDDNDKLFPIDKFINLKRLNKVWPSLAQRVGSSGFLRRYNIGDKYKKLELLDIIDEDQKSIINRLYSKDWELYNQYEDSIY